MPCGRGIPEVKHFLYFRFFSAEFAPQPSEGVSANALAYGIAVIPEVKQFPSGDLVIVTLAWSPGEKRQQRCRARFSLRIL